MSLLFLAGYEWIVIIVAILLLFGGKKIPELMKGLGKGIKEFKKSTKELSEDEEKPQSKTESNED